ncbi:DgyrCDS4786 [Dimorphilus gyrociliatus]|uniref:DgyrCDS4786 n=1 Tax=Dimorphilus gyrociliatus TaxID=2664684 RepID=A0A7I8VI08_9ANNE|nr:DgyrCDS4786 [Dimorphilus gyrociliatus]
MAIRQVNEDTNLLSGIKLGYSILDDCDNFLSVIGESLLFLPEQRFEVNAVVGPYSSTQARVVAPLFGLYEIPQISTSASSDDLSDKSRYPYFSRVVSPDKFQAVALVSFMYENGWNVFTIVYSEGPYGENAARWIKNVAAQRNICVSSYIKVPGQSTKNDWNRICKKLKRDTRTDIVVLALGNSNSNFFFRKISGDDVLLSKLYLGTDSLSFLEEKSRSVVKYNTFFTNFPFIEVPGLREEVYGEIPKNSTENPWLYEYWSKIFDCSWSKTKLHTKICQTHSKISSLKEKQLKFSEAWSSGIYDSVLIFSRVMDAIIKEDCPNATKHELNSCVTGQKILEKTRKGTFPSLTGNVLFDSVGDVIGDYDIVQFTVAGDRRTVGKWFRSNNTITWKKSPIAWFRNKKPKGICSFPCPPKHYRITFQTTCCWECRRCRENEIIIDNSSCACCPEFTWPDAETATMCLNIEPWSSKLSDTHSICLELFAVFGLAAELFIVIVYILNRKVQLIKASSLILSLFSLLGVAIILLTVFFILAQPTKQICYVQRILFNLSYTILYAPLLCKVARLLRIFRAGTEGRTNLNTDSAETTVYPRKLR